VSASFPLFVLFGLNERKQFTLADHRASADLDSRELSPPQPNPDG
jgi:hypothetical protein